MTDSRQPTCIILCSAQCQQWRHHDHVTRPHLCQLYTSSSSRLELTLHGRTPLQQSLKETKNKTTCLVTTSLLPSNFPVVTEFGQRHGTTDTTDFCQSELVLYRLVADLLRGNWCNGFNFWPIRSCSCASEKNDSAGFDVLKTCRRTWKMAGFYKPTTLVYGPKGNNNACKKGAQVDSSITYILSSRQRLMSHAHHSCACEFLDQ